jgi:hypothetical protein
MRDWNVILDKDKSTTRSSVSEISDGSPSISAFVAFINLTFVIVGIFFSFTLRSEGNINSRSRELPTITSEYNAGQLSIHFTRVRESDISDRLGQFTMDLI